MCLTISSFSANSIKYKDAHHSNSSIDTKIAEETVLKSIENDSANCCQNEKDLEDYRNLAKCCEAKAAEASIGIRKVGEASEKTLLSSATFYKLGIRGFAPFKIWTPFGSARTWETILGRWTAPTGGSILLFDHFSSDKKKK